MSTLSDASFRVLGLYIQLLAGYLHRLLQQYFYFMMFNTHICFFPPKLSTSLDLNISVYGTSIWFLKPETGRLLYLSHQLHLIFQQILSILKENYMLTFSTSLIFISVSVAQATMFSFLICLNTFLPGSLLLLSDHSDQSPFSSSRMIFHRSDHVVSLHKFPQSHLPYHHLVVYSFTRPFAISPLSTFPTSLALSFTTFLLSR